MGQHLRCQTRVGALFAICLGAALASGSIGCQAIATGMMLWMDEPTKTVKAEYPFLVDKKVAILVRADNAALFEYPHVRWEVADHLRAALQSNVPGIKVQDPREIADYQRNSDNWEQEDPATLGARFNGQRLIDVELTQYTTRQPESPHLYRGHITALVKVYNTEYPNSNPAWQAEVQTIFPPNSPGQWGTGDRAIRYDTMAAFAEEVAGKFYDRKVKK